MTDLKPEDLAGAVERLTKDVGFAEIPNAATIAARDTPEEAEAVYADIRSKRRSTLGVTEAPPFATCSTASA